ncbi:MAG: 1-(5-phosphoribosyl)-5-[(5-phosphoribosylamino)methylideneamino]imidazole-4-carboxamide isomerase [Candidatus Scalindua sp.]|nr:1-(5-phosphoribosyl)-5-[(5-phosphoribosylamino)methylideneamino]imidazole-4-carboxamide isomerase [Candidatus Scalindua sp.]
MLIFPAIDLKDGKCVRLTRGRKELETVFSEDPVQVAKTWEKQGAEILHVVDLDGAFEGKPVNTNIIEKIKKNVDIRLQVGGGIRDIQVVRELLGIGIDRLVVGTRALDSPKWLTELCGEFPGKIVVGIDAENGKVAVKGWTSVSNRTAIDFANEIQKANPIAIVFTDIEKDGMLQGPNFSSIKDFAMNVAVPVIASGGITSLEDVRKLSLFPIEGMIIGKALYTGNILLSEAIKIGKSKISSEMHNGTS